MLLVVGGDERGKWMAPSGPSAVTIFHRSNEEGDAKEFITESSLNLVKPQGAKWRSTLNTNDPRLGSFL